MDVLFSTRQLGFEGWLDAKDRAALHSPFEIVKRERKDAGEKSTDFLHFGSFLIVLRDSGVRFDRITMKRIGSVDFQPILTSLRHFRKYNFSTTASYLAPSLVPANACEQLFDHSLINDH